MKSLKSNLFNQFENLSYGFLYDFNQENLNSTVKENSLEKLLLNCGFTVLQRKSDKTFEVLSTQRGVFRTNCGSCIERTNIAQSRIAAFKIV